MARVFPPEILSKPLPGQHRSELDTLHILQADLPDDFTVFHSVHWARSTKSYTEVGEVDFVVMNRDGRTLLIEQKMGPLEETPEGLAKNYGERNKSVTEQMHRSLDRIRDRWRQVGDARVPIDVDVLLYCPSYEVRNLSAAGLDSSRIVDARRAEKLADIVESLLGPGEGDRESHFDKVESFFSQAFDLVPDVSSFVTSQKKVFTRLTEGLTRVVDGLEFSPFRLRVQASAGSGKSQLGRHFLARASEKGQRALFLCYNRPLATRIRNTVGDSGTVNNFHGFCHQFLDSIGEDIDFNEAQRDPEFWKGIPERLVAADISDEQRYDCLIVDEGQDFHEEWWEILQLFLRPDADVLWLEDPEQNIYGREPVALEGFVTYHDPRNYRTPTSIADFIREYLGFDFDCANPLPGLGAVVTGWVEAEENPVAVLERRIRDLKRVGFDYKDMVVLSCVGQGKSFLGDADKVGNIKLRRATSQYESDGNQVYTDGDVLFDTVYRFKGQQAPAVILIDGNSSEHATDRMKRVMFCGMTRATVRLEVIVVERWIT